MNIGLHCCLLSVDRSPMPGTITRQPSALAPVSGRCLFVAGVVKLAIVELCGGKMAAPLPEKSAHPALPAPLPYSDGSAEPEQRVRNGSLDRASSAQETDVWWGSYAGR